MWTRLTRDDEVDDDVAEIRRKHTGKQPPRKAGGREVAYKAEAEDDHHTLFRIRSQWL